MLDVYLGPPRHFKHLTVTPLLSSNDVELPYHLLVDAMANGTFRITEKGDGTVPTLIAINSGTVDVLILDGEQLIGARQNRTTNRSMIIAAGSQVEIPVSCMEHGRWHHVSPEMQMKPQLSPSKVRRHARDVEADHVRRKTAASTRIQIRDARLQPCDIRLQPCDIRLQPCDIRLQPGDIRLQPCDIRLQPGDIRLQPCDVRFQLRNVRFQPCDIRLQPCDVRLQFRDIGLEATLYVLDEYVELPLEAVQLRSIHAAI